MLETVEEFEYIISQEAESFLPAEEEAVQQAEKSAGRTPSGRQDKMIRAS